MVFLVLWLLWVCGLGLGDLLWYSFSGCGVFGFLVGCLFSVLGGFGCLGFRL